MEKLYAHLGANGKWGYADEQGNLVIPCQWDKVWFFAEGLAAVQKDCKWGFIDKRGNLVIPCQWPCHSSFSDGLASVLSEHGGSGYIDRQGNVVIPCDWDEAYDFREGLAIVMEMGYDNGIPYYYVIDKSGETVLDVCFVDFSVADAARTDLLQKRQNPD